MGPRNSEKRHAVGSRAKKLVCGCANDGMMGAFRRIHNVAQVQRRTYSFEPETRARYMLSGPVSIADTTGEQRNLIPNLGSPRNDSRSPVAECRLGWGARTLSRLLECTPWMPQIRLGAVVASRAFKGRMRSRLPPRFMILFLSGLFSIGMRK